MKQRLKQVHLLAGLVALVIFPLTGAYMRFYLADEFAASDRIRFSTRAGHIYILLSALIHISLGSYLRVSAKQRWANAQIAASALLLVSTALTLAAFLVESKTSLDKPVTLLAMIAALAGTLLHALIAGRERAE